MAYVRDEAKAKTRTAPQVQHGQKRVALTTRKSKPDGSHEVTHKVEHSFDPIPYMKKMKRMDGSIGKDAANSRDTHAMIAHGGTAHRHGTDLENTLRQLRDYQMKSVIDSGALAGDGRLERPAAGFDIPRRQFEDGSGMTDDSAPGAEGIFNGYAGDANTQNVDVAAILRARKLRQHSGVMTDPWRFLRREGSQA